LLKRTLHHKGRDAVEKRNQTFFGKPSRNANAGLFQDANVNRARRVFGEGVAEAEYADVAEQKHYAGIFVEQAL
jgi:hypothetical protein